MILSIFRSLSAVVVVCNICLPILSSTVVKFYNNDTVIVKMPDIIWHGGKNLCNNIHDFMYFQVSAGVSCAVCRGAGFSCS